MRELQCRSDTSTMRRMIQAKLDMVATLKLACARALIRGKAGSLGVFLGVASEQPPARNHPPPSQESSGDR
jgi:hypothetical protein